MSHITGCLLLPLQASSTADNAGFPGVGGAATAAQGAAPMATEAVHQDTADSGETDAVDRALADVFGRDHWVIPAVKAALEESRRRRELVRQAVILGLYYTKYLCKNQPRQPPETGHEWVVRTLRNENSCYNMFRMSPTCFEMLHDVLVRSYGLKSTIRMASIEALAMFLWMVGPPEPVRQAEDKFTRSMETISRKFNHVLDCVWRLANDIIKPKDSDFGSVHPKLGNHKYAPLFNNAIGAIDGTHIRVIVPGNKQGPYFNRHNDKTQNVLAICDFDRRFTFVAAGILGSAHDWAVLREAMERCGDKFPHPPQGMWRCCNYFVAFALLAAL